METLEAVIDYLTAFTSASTQFNNIAYLLMTTEMLKANRYKP